MRIIVIGGGSIGLLLAAKLANTDAFVTVVTRTEEQAGSIANAGLTLRDIEGEAAIAVFPDAADFSAYAAASIGNPEWIFITVKQKDIDVEFIHTVRRHIGAATSICCFQNGIGHLDRLREAGISSRVYAAVTTEGARRVGLNQVNHTGKGFTWIGVPGSLEGAVFSDEVHRLITNLEKAGFATGLSNSIDREIWNKLIMNTVINPVTALLAVPNGKLIESEQALKLMRSLFNEAAALAGVLGIDLASDLWDRVLTVCQATGSNRSSMLQDLDAGRRTELEWLNGSLLREAEKAGLQLPVHETIYHLIRCKEYYGLGS